MDTVSRMETLKAKVRELGTLRGALVFANRACLIVAGACLAYLLFIFGHTDVTPMNTILTVASIAGVSALVGAMLQWVGLPAEPKSNKKQSKH